MIELSPVSQSRLRGEMRVVSYEIDACCNVCTQDYKI